MRSFHGRRVNNPEELSRFKGGPANFMIWRTADGFYKCHKGVVRACG
jgi:hypothetical protein